MFFYCINIIYMQYYLSLLNMNINIKYNFMEVEMDNNYVEEGKSVAWLSYLGILLIIPILVQKNNPYTTFHVKQGLVLFIAEVIMSFVQIFIGAIPVVGWFIIAVVWITIAVLMIIGILNAVKGKEDKLPLIGQFGEKFNF